MSDVVGVFDIGAQFPVPDDSQNDGTVERSKALTPCIVSIVVVIHVLGNRASMHVIEESTKIQPKPI